MRKGNKLIQDCKVPKKRTLNTQVLNDIVNGYYLDGIEAGYKAGYDYGYEEGYRQHGQDFAADGEKAYQQGLEDGRKQGVAIDGDKRYWDGYHAAQEDGKKIYQKGLEDAWDATRKVMVAKLKGGMSNKEIRECFDDLEWMDSQDLICRYSASEIIEKIRAYEEKQKQEGRSGYISFVGEKQQEHGTKTVFPDSPCDLCRFNPPSSFDGKPCTMCPAEGKEDEKCN